MFLSELNQTIFETSPMTAIRIPLSPISIQSFRKMLLMYAKEKHDVEASSIYSRPVTC